MPASGPFLLEKRLPAPDPRVLRFQAKFLATASSCRSPVYEEVLSIYLQSKTPNQAMSARPDWAASLGCGGRCSLGGACSRCLRKISPKQCLEARVE